MRVLATQRKMRYSLGVPHFFYITVAGEINCHAENEKSNTIIDSPSIPGEFTGTTAGY